MKSIIFLFHLCQYCNIGSRHDKSVTAADPKYSVFSTVSKSNVSVMVTK
jgi:hypothetical protein